MKKKIISLILLALGLIMVVAGIYILAQAGTTHTGTNGGICRASTSIQFGADFYTTSAQATALAANAAIDLYKLVSIVTGFFFIFIGGIDICLTILFADLKELSQKPVTTQEATTEEPATVPTE